MKHKIKIAELADAGKSKRGRAEALALARQADRVIVAKRGELVVFDMLQNPPDDETLAAHLLGPTGNLRAPTLRRGKTLAIGFSEDAYKQLLFA